jgi:hypothetical protein
VLHNLHSLGPGPGDDSLTAVDLVPGAGSKTKKLIRMILDLDQVKPSQVNAYWKGLRKSQLNFNEGLFDLFRRQPHDGGELDSMYSM